MFIGVSIGSGMVPSQSITGALRDLYESMEKGPSIAPLILLQVLHMAFPQFAEKTENGTFMQQVKHIVHKCMNYVSICCTARYHMHHTFHGVKKFLGL